MKPIILLAICALALSSTAPTRAQAPAAPAAVAPDAALAALVVKYKADVKSTNDACDAARKAVKKDYVTALDNAETRVGAVGDTAGLKAIVEEKQALAGSGPLAPQAGPSLSRDLLNARNAYLRETARLRQGIAPRLKQLQSDHLRNLAAMELKARSMKNKPLIDQVVAEKLRLAGQTVIEVKDAVNPTTISQLERWLSNGKHKWYWKSAENEKGGSGVPPVFEPLAMRVFCGFGLLVG